MGAFHVYGELAMAMRESRKVGTTQPEACGDCYVATELAQQVLCLLGYITLFHVFCSLNSLGLKS